MKKNLLLSSAFLLSISAFTAQAQQLPNVGFDSWKSSCGATIWTSTMANGGFTRPGVEPTDWNGSNVKPFNSSLASADDCCTKGDADNNIYVQLKNTNKYTKDAIPGYLSLATPWVFVGGKGLIYASQYAKYGDGGSAGSVSFSYRPDALKYRYKRADDTSDKSHAIAYLWAGTFESNVPTSVTTSGVYTYGRTLEDVDRVVLGRQTDTNVTKTGTLIAKVDVEMDSQTDDWVEKVVDLEYVDKKTTPEKMNVIFSAGDYWTRGNLIIGTTLLVDDVDFVYYSTLTSLKVNDTEVALTDGTYTYKMSGRLPAASDVVATCKSQFANAAVAIDEANSQVTITVTNQGGKDTDGATQHVYTLQYPKVTETKNYTGKLNVTMAGEDVIANTDKTITIKYYDDNTADISLSNFNLGEMELGDILVPEVKVATDAAGTKTFTDGEVKAMSLAGGTIIAHVTITNGTIASNDDVKMPINVGWMASYPGDTTEIPINVNFTTDLQYAFQEEGYTYAIHNGDYSNPVYEKSTASLEGYKVGELGSISYTLYLMDSDGGARITVTGLACDDDQFSGTDSKVDIMWKYGSFATGANNAVTVAGGKVAEGTRAGLYEVSFTMHEYGLENSIYTIVFTTDEVSSSVAGLDADTFAARGIDGAIAVSGFSGKVEVFTVDGRKVADQTIATAAQLPMARGIYVVRAGSHTAKVIVK